MKILLIRFSSIGDIVLTSPVIRNLKKQLPNAEIHFCTKSNYKIIVENNPSIYKVYTYNNNLFDLIKLLKKEKYDLVIDLHTNLRTRMIKFFLGKKNYSFRKLNTKKWLYVNFKINWLPKIHIVDRYMETVSKLNIHNDQLGLDYFIPSNEEVNLDTLPTLFQKKYIVYALGGQHYTKRLPLHKMIELCQTIHKPILLLGSKEDFNRAKELVDFFEKDNKSNVILWNACGKYSLNQTASLIRQATEVYTHDTGLMHIAAAFKKKIYSIWGNTVPAFGMYPYKTEYIVWENNNLSCRPCSKIGYSKCPKKHFKCMNDLIFNN